MHEIVIDKLFGPTWTEYKDGNGKLIVTNNVLRCTGDSTSRAMKQFIFPVVPGSTVVIEVMVRLIQGEDVRLSIDTHFQNGQIKTQFVKTTIKNQWIRLKLEHTVGFEDTSNLRGHLVLGKWSGMEWESIVEYKDPIIKVKSNLPVPSVLAMGMIRKVSALGGNWELHPYFRSTGISHIEVINNTTLKVIFNYSFYGTSRPIPIVSSTTDSFYSVVAGNVDSSTNSCLIRITDGTKFIPLNEVSDFFLNLFLII
ncbi:hypothetical protein JF536_11540 [Priestia flexa]|uniref:hypothetical protein n=1 Tax=Priestia flexa TaxID=86664 RepID=UPI001A8FEC8E|nr:hypothetical protein [Priestia flexa]MBN8434729.1 hypothetical protein [Priestia flexa]MCA0967267.1 hypothetical protein [Priestia flexa]